VPEPTLYARTALGGSEPITEHWNDFSIREISGHSLASVAARYGKEDALRDTVKSTFGVDLPGPGRSASGESVSFDWMGQGQWFAESRQDDGTAFARQLTEAVADTASVTDQSDSWVRLQISGASARAVLEKLCQLDLHATAFPPGSVARTIMEHLGAIVSLVDDAPTFRLLSARSSAGSFLHSLREAANSTCGAR
jgi:sarcosine oxidase subunit gamma